MSNASQNNDDRFKAWHEWFDENIKNVLDETIYTYFDYVLDWVIYEKGSFSEFIDSICRGYSYIHHEVAFLHLPKSLIENHDWYGSVYFSIEYWDNQEHFSYMSLENFVALTIMIVKSYHRFIDPSYEVRTPIKRLESLLKKYSDKSLYTPK